MEKDDVHYARNSPNSKTDWRTAAIVLAIAGILRICMLCMTDDSSFLRDDGQEYKDIAAQLAAGRGFSVSEYRWYEPVPPEKPRYHADVFRPPLLPILGAPLFWLPVRWESAARVEVFILSMLLVAAAMLWAGAIAGDTPWAVPLTGLLFAVHPAVLHYARKFSTEQLAALCLLATLYGLVRSVKGPGSKRWGFLTGIGLGLCTLARANLFLLAIFFLFLTAWLALRGKVWARQTLLPIFFGMLVLLGPWTLRQGLAGAGWQPVTAFGPYAYWMGNHPDALASYRATDAKEFLQLQEDLNVKDTQVVVRKLQDEKRFEAAQTGPYWLALAYQWQRQNPGDTAALYAYRLFHLIRPWPSPLAFSIWQVVLIGAINTASLVFALYWFRRRGVSWLRGGCVWLCVAANALGAIPFIFVLRYRFPATEVPLLAVAGAGLALFFQSRAWRTNAVRLDAPETHVEIAKYPFDGRKPMA